MTFARNATNFVRRRTLRPWSASRWRMDTVWERSRCFVSDRIFGRTFASGLAFVVAAAAEYRRATAAAERYEQLRGAARTCDDPEASPARRTYAEFYSGR